MKLYGLIGYPLGHSFSKKYFTEKFAKEGITDCVFEAFPIPSIDEFPALLKAHPNLEGLCVTIPYKEQVVKYMDELSEEVKSTGATNSICIRDNKLIAYNTDITGFRQSFQKLLQPHHTKALVLGTGGASKAVQYVLDKLEIEYLIVSRNSSTAAGFIRYQGITMAVMNEYSMIINCTPVGMWPNENNCPAIPYEMITSKHYLYDLVYKPDETLFLQKGKSKGAVIQNGYEMLLIQAEESWRIWNSI
jgi:shikimate dehydrogenase